MEITSPEISFFKALAISVLSSDSANIPLRIFNAERIILEVRESNVPAIGLYEKYGFKNVGIRKNFYHSPVENGITMVRGEF